MKTGITQYPAKPNLKVPFYLDTPVLIVLGFN